MVDYVLNEWLWADATGDNGTPRQAESFRLLEALSRSNDRIVVVSGSSFHNKAWRLCVASSRPALEIAKFFELRFLYDPARCFILPESELPEFPSALMGIKDDDQYLIRAQLKVPDSIIVTTDTPLKTVLDLASRACELREIFVRRYLG